MTLEQELASLPEQLVRRLNRYAFDERRLRELAARSAQHDNRVQGDVEPMQDADLESISSADRDTCRQVGLAALSRGECALVVLAGGMATRMGGVVKALVEAVDGRTFLDLRLAEVAAIRHSTGRAPALWLMTSASTHDALEAALADLNRDGLPVATFPQTLSLRLAPEGGLFRDAEGRASPYAPGHGDLPEALQRSGLVQRFVTDGGKYVMIANIDNLGATLDPAIIGWHLSHAAPVSCELVDKVGSDRGGIPVRWDGRPVILEEFRLPEAFDPAGVRVFNTNTFHVDASELAKLDFDWSFFRVEKTVDDRKAVQFERLIGEMTSHIDTNFLRVPRSGSESRFLPVKDPAELQARGPEIRTVMLERGIIRS